MIVGNTTLFERNYADRKPKRLTELGSLGDVWFVPDHLEIRQDAKTLYAFHEEADLTGTSAFVLFTILDDARTALLANHYGRNVFLLGTSPPQLSRSAQLNREDMDDPGLFRTEFVTSASSVLFIYEGGLLCFTPNGSLVWRRDHFRLDRFFTTLEDDVVWYESEFEGRWGYRLADGSRIQK